MLCFMFVLLLLYAKSNADSQECFIECSNEPENMICALDLKKKNYKMFPSNCAMNGYAKCFGIGYVRTPIKYCIKNHILPSRRIYGESCPVFCPNHYRPVCGASKYRDYVYRTFNNGCYLDMINCRGDDDVTGYVEVPLQFCQRHLMKNIFQEKVMVSNMYDFRDYNE
ncbi:uncharacterized protein LOC116771271 [Danaus plexippus]|nr:uncharacterized protein LOC116771271 [Danaus plexippus]